MKLLEKKIENMTYKYRYIYQEPFYGKFDDMKPRTDLVPITSYLAHYNCGLKDARKELEPVLKELVEAITAAAEYHNTDDVNGEAGHIAWKALQKYKQMMGEK